MFDVFEPVFVWDEAFELIDALNLRCEILVGLTRVLLVLEDRPSETSQDIRNLLKAILGFLELLEAVYDQLELRVAKHFL